MDEGKTRLQTLRDERLPLLPELLGDGAVDFLGTVAGVAGGELEGWQRGQVTWHPGRSLTVRYDVSVRWPGGRVANESIIAMTGEGIPKGALELERDGARAGAWMLPHDPGLPGLVTVLDPTMARGLLDELHAPPGDVTPRMRAYRPGRRAVVQLSGEGIDVYVKVVRPGRVAALQAAHARNAEALPVPRSFGWAPEHGVVVLQALAGMTLRQALSADGLPMPPAEAVASLLNRIPAPGDAVMAPDPVESAQTHARLIARLLPDQRWRLEALTARMRGLPGSEPCVPVHGDLYEAQLMTDGSGALTGMLDIDTLANGYRINDWATFIGHLAVWEAVSPQPARVREYARALLAFADRECDPARLRERIAAVAVGMATGPFRVQQPDWPAETRRRLSLASEWMSSAERVAKTARGTVQATA